MSDFKQIILDFPKQFKVGFEIAKDIKISPPQILQRKTWGGKGPFKNIIFCGMGGSIIPAEILLLFLDIAGSDGQSPKFYIHRDYDLPDWTSPQDLVICISWSGDTEETISSYQEARKKDIPLLIITKGGKLKKLSQKDAVSLILLPQESIPPRMGAGYMFSALYTVLAVNGQILDETEAVKNLKLLKPENFNGLSKEFAEKISNKTPLIYSSYKWRNLAAFWKIFFNENAKVHAFWNGFPSLAHQELAGFNKKDNDKFFAVILSDQSDNPRQKESIKKLSAILNRLNYGYEVIQIEGSNLFEKIFNNYLLAAMTSMHLAKMRGVDPAEAEIIKEFKSLKV